MAPTLLIGSVALPTYPLLLLLAFWGGLWLTARRLDRQGVDGDHAYNAGLYGLVAGIIGARLWFVLSHWENYAPDLTQALSLSRSALAAEEGMVIAALAGLIYLQRHEVSLGIFFDAAAAGLALALVIGNIGAFLGGVALGAPADLPWAVEMAGTLRHPTQLYHALANLLILALLLGLQWRPWPGFQFWLFVILHGMSRLMLEVFKAQPALVGEGFLAVQLGALAAIVVALAVMAYNFNDNSMRTSSETS